MLLNILSIIFNKLSNKNAIHIFTKHKYKVFILHKNKLIHLVEIYYNKSNKYKCT